MNSQQTTSKCLGVINLFK